MVKVTRSTNAETGSASYLWTGKAYELQTWYTDGVQRPISPTSAVTSKVKGHGRKVTRCVWQVLGCKSRTKRHRNTKIGRKVAHATGNNAHQFQGQKAKVTRPITAEIESVSYLRNAKAYELQNCYAVGACYQMPRPAIKAYKVGYCTRAGAYLVGRTRRLHNLLRIECSSKTQR